MRRHDQIKCTCTLNQFHSLASAIDKTRTGSATVKVDKVALDALLKDHSALHGKLREVGIEPLET